MLYNTILMDGTQSVKRSNSIREYSLIDGERIRMERIKRGWTQSKLASVAGCSQPTIANLERGRGASPRVLARIAQALGIRGTEGVQQDSPAAVPRPELSLPQPQIDRADHRQAVREWSKSPLSGDGIVLASPSRGSLLIAAFDVEGNGLAALPALHYFRGWLRGYVQTLSVPPQVGPLADELELEMQRVGVSASFFLAWIVSSHSLVPRSSSYEAVARGFPLPLLILYGPPHATLESARVSGGAEADPIRHDKIFLPWRLVIATDGLLRRLGGGDEDAGRRSVLTWQLGPDRDQPLDRRLATTVQTLDDESLWIVQSMPPWNSEHTFPVQDVAASDNALRGLRATAERMLGRDCTPLLQAVGEALDNVQQHAYGGGNGSVTIRVRDEGSAIRVEVADYGPPGRARAIAGTEARSGVGVIREMVPDTEFVNGEPIGLIVVMRLEKQSP